MIKSKTPTFASLQMATGSFADRLNYAKSIVKRDIPEATLAISAPLLAEIDDPSEAEINVILANSATLQNPVCYKTLKSIPTINIPTPKPANSRRRNTESLLGKARELFATKDDVQRARFDRVLIEELGAKSNLAKTYAHIIRKENSASVQST